MVKVTFNVPGEFKKKIKIQAALNDLNLTEYIIGLIEKDIKESKLKIA